MRDFSAVLAWHAEYTRRAAMSSYERAAYDAAERKRTHYQRAAAGVAAAAARRPSLFDNGYGAVDGVKVERQQSRKWWIYTEYWFQGYPRGDSIQRPTERAAIHALRREARRLEGREEVTVIDVAREAWNEDGAARRWRRAA